jgi:nucleoside-diphosphate-sugar epimerase
MSRVLVTGATGMLGSHVVREALARGWSVRALVRDPSAARWLEEEGADLARGDLLSPASLRRGIEGCDAVVHTAATIGTGGEARAYHVGNVVGTGHVVDATAWAGARLVHVSSTAVVGGARYHGATDESAPLPELPAWDHYGRSKQAADRLVLSAHAEGRLWAAVVRPPVMYGRRDRQLAPRLAPVLRWGLVPLAGGGHTTLALVHAGSVAQGILNALEHEEAGGRVYFLTDDRPVTVRDLMDAAARGLGRPVRMLPLPRPLVALVLAGLALGLACTGRRDLAHHARGTYRMLTRDNPFSSERARQGLNWHPDVNPPDAIEDAFRWWAAQARGAAGRTLRAFVVLALVLAGGLAARPAPLRAAAVALQSTSAPGAGGAPWSAPMRITAPTAVTLAVRCRSGDAGGAVFRRVAEVRAEGDRAALNALLDSIEGELRVPDAQAGADAATRYDLAVVLAARTETLDGRARIRSAEALHRQARRVLELDPDHPGAHHLLGRLDAAVLRLGGATRLLARLVIGGEVLGTASWRRAHEYLKRAEEGAPCMPEHHFELARLLEERGDPEGARRELRHVLELAGSNDARASKLRERALRRLEGTRD